MTPRFLFTAALVLAASGAVAQEAAAPAAPSLPAITVSTVTAAELTDRVLGSGLIGAVEMVQVQPEIDGESIRSIEVEVGDIVTAGQTLAKLSDAALTLQRSQFAASRASAEASIAQAEASVVEAETTAAEANRVRDRSIALAAAGSTSKTAAESATAEAATAAARVSVALQGLNAARAQLNLVDAQIADLELKLQRTSIKAPVAGEVVARNAEVGAIASGQGEAMFTIVRDGELELKADVAQQDLLRVEKGQTASVSVAGLAEPIAGTVRLVEPTVNEATRLGRLRISLAGTTRVRSGMFGEAEVLVIRKQALAVPVSAIGATGTTALRVTEGVVREVAVETGIRDGGRIEVVSGLAEGDTVVTKAGAFVRDGDRINPVPADAGAMSN